VVLNAKDGRTTKRDEKAHGYGLKIVRKTLDEHEGMLDVGVKDGWFVASFMLPAEKVASV
jgi:nitrogen-specific signal transduction histidine kinase